MAILAFQKPDKVIMLEESPTYGKFEFRPLEPGFGITVGNALRRILLSSLDGYAINTIRIEGVEHEFASVPGAREDVTNIILNLKQVRFKRVVKDFDGEKVSITIENSSEFKAGDIGNYLTGFEVLNPDLVICHLDSKASMKIDLTINKGRGYVPAEENRQFCTDVNVLPKRHFVMPQKFSFSTSCSSLTTKLSLIMLPYREWRMNLTRMCFTCASSLRRNSWR